MVLRAMILVGGFGTRLRPLTFTKPKPLVEFINKPIVVHQIEALIEVGVKEIILAVGYQPQALEQGLSHFAEKYKIKIHFVVEKIPMGTAGGIFLAAKYLDVNDPDPFFMLNSDIIANYQFENLLKFHKSHKGEGTIYVTSVDDPSRYGVVVADESGKISAFVEKPKEQKYGNKINAGLYIFNKDIIKRIENRPTSIEREIFPNMAHDNTLYRLPLTGYWMDLGKPRDFITGQNLYLDFLRSNSNNNDNDNDNNDNNNNYHHKYESLASNSDNIIGNVIIHPTALVSANAIIGPNVVIGPHCKIGSCAKIKNSVIMENVTVEQGAFINDSIISCNCKIKSYARLDDLCIIGDNVVIHSDCLLIGALGCPNIDIKENVLEKGKVVLF